MLNQKYPFHFPWLPFLIIWRNSVYVLLASTWGRNEYSVGTWFSSIPTVEKPQFLALFTFSDLICKRTHGIVMQTSTNRLLPGKCNVWSQSSPKYIYLPQNKIIYSMAHGENKSRPNGLVNATYPTTICIHRLRKYVNRRTPCAVRTTCFYYISETS